ncbi:MAG: class I SAM-dependent methyltransferase [Pseudomonadota bacterium]
MRGLAWGAERSGFADWLIRRHDRGRVYHWASSLLAIHDIDRLMALDVPWWTYDAIAEVDVFLDGRSARVFEYGSGASTIWSARRAGTVISVEHDTDWHGLVTQRIAAQDGLCPVDLRLIPATNGLESPPSEPIYMSQKPGSHGLALESYASEIERADGPFDMIVIDGRVRQACLRHAIPCLAPDGLIVFDNSRRARYRAAISKSGLKSRRFSGLTPSLPYPDETTLLTASAKQQPSVG